MPENKAGAVRRWSGITEADLHREARLILEVGSQQQIWILDRSRGMSVAGQRLPASAGAEEPDRLIALAFGIIAYVIRAKVQRIALARAVRLAESARYPDAGGAR